MLINDLIALGHHFIPLDALPILPGDDTLSDALDAMREKRTHLLATQADDGIKFLWAGDLLDYCLKRGPVIPWLTPISTIAAFLAPARMLPATGPVSDLKALFEEGEEAVMITVSDRDQKLLGVATQEENAEGQILTLPSVSECIQGHLFAAPAPRDCPFDGTPIM